MATNKARKRKILANIGKSMMALVASALIVWIFPSNQTFKYDFQQGSFWEYDNLISPIDIVINKSNEELKEEKSAIINNKKLYFDIVEGDSIYIPKEVEGLPLSYSIVVLKDSTAFDVKLSEITAPLKFNKEKTQEALDIKLNNISKHSTK